MLHTGIDLISRFDVLKAVEIILNACYFDIPLPSAPQKNKHVRHKFARNQLIIAQYADGASLSEIADEFGISEQRVHQILRK
ncbi:MAG: sigma factor-like helix-turn-helix DNA-binding protein [Chloroflexota bacterium]